MSISRKTSLTCTWQRSHVIHQIPNLVRRLNFTEARHPCELDPVLDDPKQLLIEIALYLLTSEMSSTRVHPMPHRGFGPGRQHRGIRRNPNRNVSPRNRHWLSCSPAAGELRGGWPGELQSVWPSLPCLLQEGPVLVALSN